MILSILSLLSCLSLFLLSGPSYAAVFDIPSGNVTALIAAINAANANGEDNTINLEPGTYTLTAIDNGAIDSNSNGLPVITGRISINGNDALNTVIERDPAAPMFRIFSIASSGKLSINGTTVRRGGGFRTQLAGGFSNAGSLTITRSIIEQFECCDLAQASAILNTGTLKLLQTHVRDNSSGHGAAIFNSATMTIESSSITFNTADAPTVANLSPGETTIQNSAVSDNISHSGALANTGTMMIINSTVANNSAFVDFPAGIENTGTLKVSNSTISGNYPRFTHPGGPGGVFNGPGASVELQNSILAGNIPSPGFSPDCQGMITSLGNNIIGDPTGCDITLLPNDLTGDPGLDAFTDNGTPGNGHFPLLETSRAIDAGNNEVCFSNPVLATDQIGNPRVGICDIGAIEFEPVPVLTVALDVRPGSAENPVNPKSKGVIPVAILSTNSFDASTIDQASLRFGPGQALAEGNGHLVDLNGDGQLDLLLHFRTQDAGIQCGESSVSIIGQTVNGIPIQGSDSITTVGCKPVAAGQKKK